ncbi:MAG: hypothetical protein ACREX3_05545 [Gammaproteobacteria bacterium]
MFTVSGTGPDRSELPHVYRAAGARTVLEFERHAKLWAIVRDDATLRLEVPQSLAKGGWGSAAPRQSFPDNAEGLNAIVTAILEDIETQDD